MALEDMRRRTGKNFVPQVFIGDEYIGGYEDFNILDARGEIDRKLGLKAAGPAPGEERVYDLIIIGGGPAGLTAAVYGARKNLDILLLADQLGGQPMLSPEIENYMGYQFITGPELMAKFEEQTRRYRVDLKVSKLVTRVGMEGPLKQVTVRSGETYKGRALIIASGKRSRVLDIPGENDYAGRGVSYCATCDGPLYAGETVMVAGGGNSGMQAALEMSAICSHVHLVSLTRLSGDEVLIGKVEGESRIHQHLLWQPVEIKGNENGVSSVVISSTDGKETEEVAVKALFVEVGLRPNSAFAVDLLELNRRGEIVVDCECRTGVKGIFAAGDVTQVRDKQIVVAAGEGAKAALSAYEYLLKQR